MNFETAKQNTGEPQQEKLAASINDRDINSALEVGISKNEKMIEVPEFGITVRERTINLPPQRQEIMGISSIRRKEIITLPDELKPENISKIKNFEQRIERRQELKKAIHSLSEGKFPSYRTWNHELNADEVECGKEKLGAKRFKQEGLFFQKIIPLERMGRGVGTYGQEHHPYFKRIGSQLSIDEKRSDYSEDAILEYDLSVLQSNESPWADGRNGAVFLFGSSNKALAEYIRTITSNEETKEILRIKGWNVDKPIEFVETKQKESSLLHKVESEKIIYKPKVDFLPYPPGIKASGIRTLAGYSNPQNELKVQFDNIYKINVELAKQAWKSTSALLALVDGRPVDYSEVSNTHPLLPIIQHPAVRPLRWCHADAAFIATRKSMNVLFFES